MARTPVRDRLLANHPWSLLTTSGEAVGLPAGQMGNSEVGHLNLGAGRVVQQDVTRISTSIRDGSFFELPELASLARTVRGSGGALHLIGLCSDGGVHSEIGHLHALLDWADRARIPLRLHCVTDGRDTSPTSGIGWIRELEARTAAAHDARIATVSGRYFTMDRDKRWPRTELGYRAIVEGAGPRANSASEVRRALLRGRHDRRVPATGGDREHADGREAANGRGTAGRRDHIGGRARIRNPAQRRHPLLQLPRGPGPPAHDGPDSEPLPPLRPPSGRLRQLHGDDPLRGRLPPPRPLPPTLARPRSGRRPGAGRSCTQLRMAETEKYPHVTYFFNGGVEDPFPRARTAILFRHRTLRPTT